MCTRMCLKLEMNVFLKKGLSFLCFCLFTHPEKCLEVSKSIVLEQIKAEKFSAFCVCVISKIINWTASACNPIRHRITFSARYEL